MSLINIFIALVVSIGFWKLSSKEQKLKSENNNERMAKK